MDQLKLLIITTNREISQQYFKIALGTCEVTNQQLIIWLNTKNDDISKLQITFSAIELEYFHVILQEILNSENNRLTFVVVLNITSTLTASFSRDNGQKALNKWFNGGYFVKKGDFVYLGTRLIMEFTSYLKSHRPDQICKLCSELVFTGRRCGTCDRLLHSYCLEKYLTNLDKCPSCKTQWVEKSTDMTLPTSQELRNIQASMDSDDDEELTQATASISSNIAEDRTEPGPSQRNTNLLDTSKDINKNGPSQRNTNFEDTIEDINKPGPSQRITRKRKS